MSGTEYDDVCVHLSKDTVSLDSTHVVGLSGVDRLTNNQTRYVTIGTDHLTDWAEKVEEMAGGNPVIVGVTPDRPLIAKTDEDSDLCVAVAPRISSERDE